MEFLIYDHACPVTKTDFFADVVPWISVVLSLYITANFLVKLMDTTFESQIESLIVRNSALEMENEELKNECEKQIEVIKTLTSKFVIDEHHLTKVD